MSSVTVLSFYSLPCPLSNRPPLKADVLHPRIGPLLLILIPFLLALLSTLVVPTLR